jgi:tRNA (guanine26-N2/guanine27-N2)-dimethyltransferase
MAVDRDLGVALVRAWGEPGRSDLTGWETSAATGVRGLRLLAETGRFSSFLFTEAGDAAYGALVRSAEGVRGATAVRADGRRPPSTGPFDYVDVDPYGSPIPFLPGALASIRTGGLLAVTATDMMVLAGAQPAACRRRYGANPIRGRLGPESGLRILLAYLAREVRARGRSIRPVLAYVGGHHVRVYVGIAEASAAPDPVAPIVPVEWTGPPLGDGGPFGPLWLGPLFDPPTLDRAQVPPDAAEPREAGRLLERMREESRVPSPFYFEPNEVASQCGLPSPPSVDALLSELRHAGFRASRTHARPEGIRTDAPRDRVEELARVAATRS